MSWAKIDDRFLMNPKVMSAGLEGRALYLAGILYCAGELTDGKIPAGAVRKLAALSDVEDAPAATERLISLNLWEPADDGGYLIHDYLEYNPAGEKVRSERSAAKERMSRHRSPELLANNVRSSSSPSPSPSHTKESPKKETNTPRDLTRQTQLTAFCDFYAAYPNKRARPEAEKAWVKLSPNDTLREAIMAGLSHAKGSEEWHEDGGKYVPHPATFLNHRRWEDVYTSLGSRPVANSRYSNGAPRPSTMQGVIDDTARALRTEEMRQDALRQSSQLKGLLL